LAPYLVNVAEIRPYQFECCSAEDQDHFGLKFIDVSTEISSVEDVP
tara:strand:- start:1624 stop:1761 length:138 start_codon:yes stop_codon:yes gene_type:complete